MLNSFLEYTNGLTSELVDRFFNWVGGLSLLSGIGAVSADSGTISFAELLSGLYRFNLSVPHTLFVVSLLGGLLFIIEKIIVIKIRLIEKRRVEKENLKDVEN